MPSLFLLPFIVEIVSVALHNASLFMSGKKAPYKTKMNYMQDKKKKVARQIPFCLVAK